MFPALRSATFAQVGGHLDHDFRLRMRVSTAAHHGLIELAFDGEDRAAACRGLTAP
jgi:hypothetical protein